MPHLPVAPVVVAAVVVTAGASAVLSACGGGGEDGQRDLTVFAAASLARAAPDLERTFEAAHPEIDLRFNLAGSSALRAQILDGAPADVFASANESVMATVVDAGVTAAPPVRFASNQLALGVPVDNPGGVTGVEDLADEDLLVGLCASGVPCGDLARELLASLGVDAAIDTNEPDVRALVTKLAAGELDVGLVYRSDVAPANPEVAAVPLPETARFIAAYVAAPLTSSGSGAELFVAFLRSVEAQAVLADHGFGSP